MKKNLFYLFALICSMSLFTACSDDDEPTTPPNEEPGEEQRDLATIIEEDIVGNYKGDLSISLMQVPLDTLARLG